MKPASHLSNDLQVGLAGAGMISLYHLRGWQQIDGASVMTICESATELPKWHYDFG